MDPETATTPAGAAPLAQFSSWVYDPSATNRFRGLPTATLVVSPGVVTVVPVTLPRSVMVPAVEYRWPSIVVQRLVWSYRLNLPGRATVLLDINGQLGSARTYARTDRLAQVLKDAGFDVLVDTVRSSELPHPVRLRDHADQKGRLPASILVERSWWPEKPKGVT